MSRERASSRWKSFGHVGVQVASVTADGGHGESEADHGVAIERADDVTTGLIGDDKGDVGLDLKIGFTPDGFLNGDAAVEVVEGGTFADGEVGGHDGVVSCKLSVFSRGEES